MNDSTNNQTRKNIMSIELYEQDIQGMLPTEINYFGQVHDALTHCSKHGDNQTHPEIQNIGMGQLTSEWAPAFRLVFDTPQAAAKFDVQHKSPTEPAAEIHHPGSKPTINVGQPRMLYILTNNCGMPELAADMLIANAAKQYNNMKSTRR